MMELLRVTSDEIVAPTWPAPILREHLRGELTPKEFRRDFARRLGIAEEIKQSMRRRYVAATRGRASFADHARRAIDFWGAYEALNVAMLPEDPVYSKVTQGVAMSTTADFWELGAAAAGQLRILESFIGGEAAASAVARAPISRVTTQGTGTAPTAYTPEKFNSRSPPAAGTYYGALGAAVAWGTAQAVLAANPLAMHVFNAFGGSDRWVAQPGEEIYCVNAEFVSLRSSSGTAVCTAMAIVEEI